ncbi:MAG: flagellar motor protein MotB [Deltaproteobacteria bacterium]|nr:flagellar motor protein MotB [Deltaproteobacteria bacterium]
MPKTDITELTRKLEAARRKSGALRKRLVHAEAEDDTLLITVSDLMTILLIFFIMISRMDVYVKAEEPVSPIPMEAPAASTVSGIISPADNNNPAKSEAKISQPTPVPAEPDDRKRLTDLKQEFLESLDEEESSDLYVRIEDQKLVVVLGERVIFQIGQAEILNEFKPLLGQLARFLSTKEEFNIVVSGHTDNTPIRNRQFPSNWELSVARAVNVARFLIDEGVAPGRISVEGFSSFKPLFENDTEVHKQANRRVEVALIQKQE